MEKHAFLDKVHPVVAPCQIIQCLDEVFDLSEHFCLGAGHPAMMLNLSFDQCLDWHPHFIFTDTLQSERQLRKALIQNLAAITWKPPSDTSAKTVPLKKGLPAMKRVQTLTFTAWSWLNSLKVLLLRAGLFHVEGNDLREWFQIDVPTLVFTVDPGKLPPNPIDIPVLPETGLSSSHSSSEFRSVIEISDGDSDDILLPGEHLSSESQEVKGELRSSESSKEYLLPDDDNLVEGRDGDRQLLHGFIEGYVANSDDSISSSRDKDEEASAAQLDDNSNEEDEKKGKTRKRATSKPKHKTHRKKPATQRRESIPRQVKGTSPASSPKDNESTPSQKSSAKESKRKRTAESEESPSKKSKK